MVVTVPVFVLLAVLLLVSASISATEAAMLSINKVRLRHLMEQGHRSARLTYQAVAQVDRVIATLLVANNLVNVAISAIGSWIFVTLFGPEEGLVAATVVITVILLVVAEVTPKLLSAAHPEMVAFAVVRPLRVLIVLLYPLAALFGWAGRLLLRLLGIPATTRSPLVTEEELKVMIQMGREEGILGDRELRMLQRIFEFSDSVVREAMVSRGQIAGIDLNTKPDEVLDVLIEQGHSRIPVYRGSPDHIVGVIYARDVLAMVRHGGLFVLSDLIRPVVFVPETKRVAELLSEFQRDKIQIAIVQDAKGVTVGLVTIEDLLEEIVGEIHEAPPRA
ncbi:MAG: HlyC/CorC family transporter [Candidatus Omnitrophica bacterium]|nr:HlyC/CorC family transporter [Candidatus Omnitrophota bacterium]